MRARPGDERLCTVRIPTAVYFGTPGEAMADVMAMTELLFTTECVFLTLPCQYESTLLDLNGYTTTRTAHLFTETQFDFVLKFKLVFLVYEITPPKGDTHVSHHDVIRRLEEFGYSTDTGLIYASMFGDHISHLRWFAIAVLDGPNINWHSHTESALLATSSSTLLGRQRRW